MQKPFFSRLLEKLIPRFCGIGIGLLCLLFVNLNRTEILINRGAKTFRTWHTGIVVFTIIQTIIFIAIAAIETVKEIRVRKTTRKSIAETKKNKPAKSKTTFGIR